MVSIFYRFLWFVTLAMVLGVSATARAESAVPATAAPADPALPGSTQAEPGDGPDKCNQQPLADKAAEKVQSGLFEFSCRTVRWIDSLFGSSRDFPEENISGKLTFGFAWNEYEGWDPSLRYRVRMDLPNLTDRWDAFLGRVDEADYISGSETNQESSLRRGVTDSGDTEWLLGLGYKDREGKTGRWDYSIGMRLRTPPRMYVKAVYEKVTQFSPAADLRYRQTFFWRDGSVGFGTTTHLDSARELSPTDILRWEFIGKVTEVTQGMEWWLGNTWYHHLGDERGVLLRSFVRGATDAEVELIEYGFELTWRRPIGRDWLFINAGPTLTWPRERLHEKREASLGVQVLVEMRFGYLDG